MTSIKQALLAALRAHLEGELATMRRLALDAAEAATHEDNRPESDKDMRSTEASYIARGQAARVLDLERELGLLGALDLAELRGGPARAGALVEVRTQGKTSRYFLVPASGGVPLEAGGVAAQSLSIQSPLGAVLVGLSEGDEAELSGPKADRVFEILRVRLPDPREAGGRRFCGREAAGFWPPAFRWQTSRAPFPPALGGGKGTSYPEAPGVLPGTRSRGPHATGSLVCLCFVGTDGGARG